ncbi:MAG: T9SS type A sorting domain-containing protein, partial [Rhodothermia bacterium]
LWLSNNALTGPLPDTLSALTKLKWLILAWNAFEGPIPLGFTAMTAMTWFTFEGTDLCEPDDPDFQAWLAGIAQVSSTGAICSDDAGSGIVASDSLALVAFYDSLDGENWTTSTGWLDGPVPTWIGVRTTGNRVTEISFNSNNGLKGRIPDAIADLSSLKTLSIISNPLTGPIPTSVAGLSNLDTLTLSANQHTGPIPQELGKLDRLVFLDLRQNELTGSIPSEIGNMTSLLTLDLSNNQLDGAIPGEMSQLANLQDLFIDNNLLAGPIPLSFVNLTKLKRFDFQETEVCESTNADLQAWLAGLDSLSRTGLICVTVATEDVGDLPSEYELSRNYPNPFNPSTTLSYALPERAQVRLTVFDALGRAVRELVRADQAAGRYSVSFDAQGLPSGMYFYRLEAGAFVDAGKMQLVR